MAAIAPEVHPELETLDIPVEDEVGFNVLIHALGSAAVLVLLLVPGPERWVNSHVMSG